MKIYRIAQSKDILKGTLDAWDAWDKKYISAPSIVDGMEVIFDVPNTSSISASLNEYIALKRIRQVPMSDFDVNGKHYSVEGDNAISRLTEAIRVNKVIKPLIVVVDKEGPYVLEGATRLSALYRLKKKYFPALVIIDTESFEE